MSPRRSRRGGIHGPVAVPGARLRPGRRDCDWYTGQRDHGYSSTTYLTVSVQLSRLLDALLPHPSSSIKLGCGDFPISEAVDEVIVHHSDCLHMCVYNSGTHECESAVFQVLAKRIGFGRGSGNLFHNFPAVHFGLSADKTPRICIKTSELLLNCEKRPRVAEGLLDF